MKELVIDGVRYRTVEDFGPIKIVVIERGFIYVGRVETDVAAASEDDVRIGDARSLIRWGSTQHLGELVNGPLANTKLGARCIVRVRRQQIIHMIEVNQDAWRQHIDG